MIIIIIAKFIIFIKSLIKNLNIFQLNVKSIFFILNLKNL